MSVQISAVRLVRFTQLDIFGDTKKLSGTIDSAELYRHGLYIEVVSSGWSGSRGKIRVKRVPVSRALAYVNRLLDGGWISDDVYHDAYTAVDSLVHLAYGVYEHTIE